MIKPQRSTCHVIARQDCLAVFGGQDAIAAIWHAAPDAFVKVDEADHYAVHAGDQCLVIFDLRRDMQRALMLQQRLLGAGASVVFLAVEPGAVQLGPVVIPRHGACLDCQRVRVETNHRRGKVFAQELDKPWPLPFRPFSPTARHAVMGLMAALLKHELGSEASVLPPGTYYSVRKDILAIERHHFIAVTDCPSCDIEKYPSRPLPLQFVPRVKRSASDKRPPNPRLSLAGARDLFVDRHCGLIKHVFKNMQSDLMPLFTSERAYSDRDAIDYNHGRAFNFETSEMVAILEGVERYAGNEPRDGMVALRGSRAQMVAQYGDQVVDMSGFILHTEQQQANPEFKFEPYTESLECGWVWAHSVRNNAPVLVPEQLGYYNIRSKPGLPANRFVYDSSNGGSLGGSIEEASLGGLHEVVERDAYFATWYSRVAPARIDTRSIDDRHSAALIARCEAEGFELYLFDMTSEARIPVVGAMIVDPSDDAKVKSYCASACEGRWNGAIFSALAEVTTSMGVYRRNETLDRERARAMFDDHALVTDMFDHVLLYSLNESYDRLRFLLDGEVRTLQQCRERIPDSPLTDLSEELKADCAKVLEVAHDIIIVDQTFSQLRPLGLSAAKVLVPGLLPVTFGHQYRRIDLDRLDRFARFNGASVPRFTHDNVNPFPHNFP